MPPSKIDAEAVEHSDYARPSTDTPHRRTDSDTTLDGKDDSAYRHTDRGRSRQGSTRSRQPSVAALLKNPLAGMTEADVLRDVDTFVETKGLKEHQEAFRKGALIARVNQREGGFEFVDMLSEDDKNILRHEVTHRWSQPFALYFLVVLCAGSAIVQGMDQTAVNGAQQFYFDEFQIENRWQQGLLNGAPYLCSALIGCWTNAPLNKLFGRRGTIFISCLISFASSFWMAAAHTWWNLLLARFALGFAVGAKSSTTPVYAAESAPKTIRGALTMMWQMWTAFGIMLGFVSSVAFQGLQWPRSVPRKTMHFTDIEPLKQNLTLEELDTVFNVGNRQHARYYTDKMPWYFNKNILRKDVEPYPALYQFDGSADPSEKANEISR